MFTSTTDHLSALLHDYADRIDAGDLAGVADLLRHAEIMVPPDDRVIGAEELRNRLEKSVILYQDGTPRTKHLVTNITAEIDEEAGTASTRAHYLVLQNLEGGPIVPIVAGRYHDRFERVGGVWRFTARRYGLTDMVGDISGHLRPGLLGSRSVD